MPQKIGDIELYGVEELSKLLDIRRVLSGSSSVRETQGRKLARKWYMTSEALRTTSSSQSQRRRKWQIGACMSVKGITDIEEEPAEELEGASGGQEAGKYELKLQFVS